MAQGIEVIVDGVPYSSITKACKAVGVSKAHIYAKADSMKMKPLDVLIYYIEHKMYPVEDEAKQAELTVNGKVFPSIKLLCDHFGLVQSTANEMRERKGFTWEQTIEYYERKKRGGIPPKGQVEVKGKIFKNIHEACNYHGYTYHQIKNMAFFDYLTFVETLEMYIDGKYPVLPNRRQVGAVEYPTAKATLIPFELYTLYHAKAVIEQGVACEVYIEQRLPKLLRKHWFWELKAFGKLNVSPQEVQERFLLTGLNPQKLLDYFKKHGDFPEVGVESYYIQYHTFPSIEIACLHFDLKVADVQALQGKYSWNGAFAYLLKGKCR